MSRIPRTYRISPDTDRAIKALAALHKTSEADVVGQAVMQWEKKLDERIIEAASPVPVKQIGLTMAKLVAAKKILDAAPVPTTGRRIYGVQRERTPILKPSAKSL